MIESKSRGLFIVAACLAMMMVARVPRVLSAELHEGDAVAFNRDIRPILSDKCFTCH